MKIAIDGSPAHNYEVESTDLRVFKVILANLPLILQWGGAAKEALYCQGLLQGLGLSGTHCFCKSPIERQSHFVYDRPLYRMT
jgi:hypothetical protein